MILRAAYGGPPHGIRHGTSFTLPSRAASNLAGGSECHHEKRDPLVSAQAKEALQGPLNDLGGRHAVAVRPLSEAVQQCRGEPNGGPPKTGGNGTRRNMNRFGPTQVRLQAGQSDVLGVRRGDRCAEIGSDR